MTAIPWAVLIALCISQASTTVMKGGDVVKDPYDLCSNPLLELGSLDLGELRQYETSAERVTASVLAENVYAWSLDNGVQRAVSRQAWI